MSPIVIANNFLILDDTASPFFPLAGNKESKGHTKIKWPELFGIFRNFRRKASGKRRDNLQKPLQYLHIFRRQSIDCGAFRKVCF